MRDSVPEHLDRRTFLGGCAAGATATMAGCFLFEREEDAPTTTVDDDRAQELAERFAPAIYFDTDEKWFPTDPRTYEQEADGETVVNGFDALDGYTDAYSDEAPPDPAIFYHAVEYEGSPLAVVQFWVYSVFDQFTTNFHWHDWEVLQVFIDTEEDEAKLFVASSHSRSVPNNEFLDPEPDRRPRVLTELGSHSSGLSVNRNEDTFDRFPLSDDVSDITNSVVEGVQDVTSIPLAYGLPRDEGFALPFLVPELDGEPLVDHDRLPNVAESDLLPNALTIRSLSELLSPPTDLPKRSTGLQFDWSGRDEVDADVGYDLRPSADLEHIADFTGPTLSFEFSIPDFGEDAVASYLSPAGVPWKGPRYENPAADISEPKHRQALADRYEAIGEPSPVNQVIVDVSQAISSDDAPEDEGITTFPSPLEMFALFESDPEAVPTFNSTLVVRDVPTGEHRLTVNGAGVTPHSETVAVESDSVTLPAGANGEIPMVARENAVKFEVDPSEADSEIDRLAMEDDFAGKIYDAPLTEPDAVYIHRGGAYTSEVRDTDDEVGAFRVNPAAEERIRLEEPRTGKTPLATYLADIAAETRDEIAAKVDDTDGDDSDGEDTDGEDTGGQDSDGQDDGGGGSGSENAVNGLLQALDAVVEAAERAAERAAAGDRSNADASLETVANRLERVGTRLSEASDAIPDDLNRAAENRLDQARRRSQQALDAEKL